MIQNIFTTGKNINDLTQIVNNKMNIISSWFTANLLSLNLKKTNYILFGNKKMPDTCIKLNNETISHVYQTQFLGVLIQSNLKWNEHISSIANRISKVIGIINKLKHTLSTALSLVNSTL